MSNEVKGQPKVPLPGPSAHADGHGMGLASGCVGGPQRFPSDHEAKNDDCASVRELPTVSYHDDHICPIWAVNIFRTLAAR